MLCLQQNWMPSTQPSKKLEKPLHSNGNAEEENDSAKKEKNEKVEKTEKYKKENNITSSTSVGVVEPKINTARNEEKPQKSKQERKNIKRLCTFSPYRKRKRKVSEALLVFNGKLLGNNESSHCKVLIDSGCEEIVISEEYAKKILVKREKTNLKAELWDGTLVPMSKCSGDLVLKIGPVEFKIRPYIVDWIGYDIILGKKWLTEVNPIINWKENRVGIKMDNQIQALDAESAENGDSHLQFILSGKQFSRLARKKHSQLFHVLLRPFEKSKRKAKNNHDINDLLREYEEVFKKPNGIPPKRDIEMKIQLEKDTKPVMGPLYKLSVTELAEMKSQINKALENGYIRPSISPWGSPVLFTKKKDGGLRMCIDYRALNKKTIKNQVPIPRIDEVWDQVGGAQFFSTLDLREGYHQIRMREEDIEKTAFRTRYGQFEYLVTPFGLTGAPGCFQTLMNNIFRPHIDDFILVYIDDILIYSKTREEHLKHLETALKLLKENKVYCKESKCHFFKTEVEYLGHIISRDGIKVNPKKISAVSEWEPPDNVKQVQSFLGFCNYYRKFIKDFSKIAYPLTELTKKEKPFEWNENQQESFDELKKAMTNTPVLRCADPKLPYEVTTDASDIGIGGVLTQTDDSGARPVAYTSRKLSDTEQRYSTPEKELLSIIHALETWRPYLHGSKFIINTDHHPLKYLDTQKSLSRKQARWVEFMQEFNYEIKYIKGKTNIVADALSRKGKSEQNKSVDTIRKLLVMTKVNVSKDTLSKLEKEYFEDEYFKSIWIEPKQPYSRKGSRLYFENRLCIPKGTVRDIILHDNHESLHGGHRGISKTISLIKRHYYWPTLKSDVKNHIKSCKKCQEAKGTNAKPGGLLRPFPPPQRKWEVITMDFMFRLPKTKDGYDGILVVVDKLSKRTRFVPLTKKQKVEHVAEVFYTEIYKHHGLPRVIVSDRDTRFTSKFWEELMKLLQVKLNLSSAFHPQTDGQSERMFRTIQEMIRCFVSYSQKDWKKYLPGLEFSLNNHVNDSTTFTPFFLEYGQDPLSVSDILFSDESDKVSHTNTFIEEIKNATKLAKEAITAANEKNSEYYNKNRPHPKFNDGDYVMLSTKHLPIKKGRVKKFAPKYIGPFRVAAQKAQGNAYRLDLPDEWRKLHDTFHVSLLKPFRPRQNNTEFTADPKKHFDIEAFEGKC